MPTSAGARRTHRGAASATARPLIIYVARSLDGTTFALDGASQQGVHGAFPNVRVTTRRLFISHDSRDAFARTVGRFEDPIAVLLTNFESAKLVSQFGAISFRDSQSEK